jgi:hypothetical protein
VYKKIALEIEKKGIVKIDNFFDVNEIRETSNIIKYYSAPKNTPNSYFPTNFKTIGLKILKLNFIKFFHSLKILQISKKKKLGNISDEFFKKKSELRFIDAYYSKISNDNVLPWHTDQAYSGKKDVTKFNHPDSFYLKIFIYLTDVSPDNGCMSYIPETHKIGYTIRRGIYNGDIQYRPYWALKDFKKIIIENENYFRKYFENTKILDNFFEKTKNLDQEVNSKNFGYSAKAGSAIIFDEGGIHKGSKPSLNDRMVLRYLYSLKKKDRE